jgi:hypothetical protein
VVRVHPGPPALILLLGLLCGRDVDVGPVGSVSTLLASWLGRISWTVFWKQEKGAVAQLGERGLCKPEVVGSIPSSSTRSKSFFASTFFME